MSRTPKRPMIVRTVDFSLGYLRFIYPEFVVTQWYMFGDHDYYCPVEFS